LNLEEDKNAVQVIQSISMHRTSLLAAKRAQENTVAMWNSTINEVSEVYMMPLSDHDETSVMGTGAISIEMLRDTGMISLGGNSNNDWSKVKLAED
jgi:hypothetical protein